MNNFKGKKILVLGLGINQGGLGSAKFFAKAGAEVTVTDLKTEDQLKSSLDELKDYSNIRYVLGKHDYKDIDEADLVIRNQALKPNNEYRIYAEKSGKKVETDVGVFLDYVSHDQLIGVTGTKGKSTTSSLIYEVLKASGKKVVHAGNIGKSVLDTLDVVDKETLIVLEISSFQLEAFKEHKISPKWAVITNIHPDHLDYYGSMENYIAAKRVIAENQTDKDYLFLNKNDEITNSSSFLKDIKSHVIKFSTIDLPEDFTLTIPGDHNRENAAAALAVAKTFDIAIEEVLEAMKDFQGVPFRLELVKEWEGVKIYNDTAATGPTAAISALNSFKNPIMIVGGVDKGLPYEELAYNLDRKAKAVYFLDGTATDKIKSLMKILNIQRSTYFDLDSLLKDLRVEAKKGDIILFSPAAASFNMFQNEFDRGRKFNEAVEKIFK